MSRDKLEELLLILGTEVAKAKKAAVNTKQSADEIAKTAAHSMSQAGDRTHSQGQADITQVYYQRLLAFKQSLEKAVVENAEVVQPPCWIEIEFVDGTKNSFYLVEDPVTISGFTIVSVSSPLGSVLLGKKVGSNFSFESSVDKKSGMIVNIE